jgi:hypothetical protein
LGSFCPQVSPAPHSSRPDTDAQGLS